MTTLLEEAPYSLAHQEKQGFMIFGLKKLIEHHKENNKFYRNIISSIGYDPKTSLGVADLPMLPVRIFKELPLFSSLENEAIGFKTLSSSGTSGQKTAKIYIDSETSSLQIKVLTKIVSEFIGTRRLPTLIIDAPGTLGDRQAPSARAAGILGFGRFSRGLSFALNNDMSINWNVVREFESQNRDNQKLIFGFTSIIWIHLIKELMKSGVELNLQNSTLFHGGGWKKVAEFEQVDPRKFKDTLRELVSISNIHDYYGMAEQTGSILVECAQGYLHTSNFSDVLIRDPYTHKILGQDRVGLIETVSLLPRSYPGHILLTEDLGIQVGIDDCRCGRLGKYILVKGRIKLAELRGCSDTYQQS